MPVTAETLALVADLRSRVDSDIDDVTRQLAGLYVRAWDQLYSVWYTPLAVLSGQGKWPGRAVVFRAVGGAAEASGRELRRLTARMTELLARNVANAASAASLSQTDIVRSQLPTGLQLGIAAGVGVAAASMIQPLAPAVMASVVAGILARVTTDMGPMPAQVVARMRQTVVRGPHRGLRPEQRLPWMLRTMEKTFNTALTRSLTAARTAVADGARETTRRQHEAHRAVLLGWRWTSRRDASTCAVCFAMDGRALPLSRKGPFDHPNGRCMRVPVVKPWRLLGIDLPEPESVADDAERAFFALPEEDQRRIMGPNRLRMLRNGTLRWADLAQSIRRRNRQTVKLRPLAA
jgi:hypothetical protein